MLMLAENEAPCCCTIPEWEPESNTLAGSRSDFSCCMTDRHFWGSLGVQEQYWPPQIERQLQQGPSSAMPPQLDSICQGVTAAFPSGLNLALVRQLGSAGN